MSSSVTSGEAVQATAPDVGGPRVCKACRDRRCHTKVEWRNHPLAGHGLTLETGWTHPETERLHNEEAAALRTASVNHEAPKLAPEAK